jgi:osmotically-inducible protein OsmY
MSLPVGLVACAPTETRQSTGAFIDDAAITTKIKAELAKDPVAKATQVKVETYNGVVQLSGFVDSQQSASRAAELARSVPGVSAVRNDIRVKPAS